MSPLSEPAPIQLRITPTAFQLQAAVHVARILTLAGNSPQSLAASYERIPTGGLYRARDFQAGQVLLHRAGLASVDPAGHVHATEKLLRLRDLPDDVAAETLLFDLLSTEPPLWLYAVAPEDEVQWENVPDADQVALRQLIADAARREALLLSLARTIDAARLADIGTDGEEYVLAACRSYLCGQNRPDLADEVRRVSLTSDQLGYDVTSPDTAGHRHRIEVKTASASFGRVEFFLSRNEAAVGQRDPGWSLVVVRREHNDQLEIVGWCRAADIASFLPHDVHPNGRWSAVRLSVPLERFTPGLPLDTNV